MLRDRDSGVACPECKAATMEIRFMCLETVFVCKSCGRRYSLEELARRIEAQAFERIERSVGDQLSDRI